MTKKSFLAELSCRDYKNCKSKKMFLSLLDFITVVINFHNENSNRDRGGKVSFIRAGWMPNFLIEQESPRINLNIIERLMTPPLPLR